MLCAWFSGDSSFFMALTNYTCGVLFTFGSFFEFNKKLHSSFFAVPEIFLTTFFAERTSLHIFRYTTTHIKSKLPLPGTFE